MDVHQHTHTERKKFTHYLWEFLMLFLAVFCGFLAENFRERLVNKEKEKHYAESLYDDLKKDTIHLSTTISQQEMLIQKMQNVIAIDMADLKNSATQRL